VHYILSFSHEAYGRATSISRLTSWTTGSDDASIQPVSTSYYNSGDDPTAPGPRQNATFVVLCRESDLQGVMNSVRETQVRNSTYHFLQVGFDIPKM
jgi:alpha 1,2-mannosyltransferase